MRKNKMKPYQTYLKSSGKDAEGIPNMIFDKKDKEIEAEIWPASGKVQAEMYGMKLAYIMNMITDKRNEITEDMGIDVLGSGKADHKVISKKAYTKHIVYELERIIP